jgi:hypothetical protein
LGGQFGGVDVGGPRRSRARVRLGEVVNCLAKRPIAGLSVALGGVAPRLVACTPHVRQSRRPRLPAR